MYFCVYESCGNKAVSLLAVFSLLKCNTMKWAEPLTQLRVCVCTYAEMIGAIDPGID